MTAPAEVACTLREDPSAALRIVDTAPEVDAKRAIRYLREADWALVPVKGPEAGSVLALPLLLDWLEQAHGARLLGFVPTMYKGRRGCPRLPSRPLDREPPKAPT